MQSAHHRTTSSGYIFATKACVNNRKKPGKQQYLTHMSSQCGELRPTMPRSTGEFGAPQQISTGFASGLRYCSDVTRRKSTKLCTGIRLIYFLRPSLAFSYFGSVTAWHSSSGRHTNYGVLRGMELQNFRSSSFSTDGTTYIPRAAITLGIGPHSSYGRPAQQMRTLYFGPVSSFFLFVSSPNLSGHRLYVYRTSTHGVALV